MMNSTAIRKVKILEALLVIILMLQALTCSTSSYPLQWSSLTVYVFKIWMYKE